MHKTIRLTILLLLCLSASCLNAQTPSVKQEIDSMAIFIGSQSHLTLSVQAKKGQKVEMPTTDQLNTMLMPGVEVLEASSAAVKDLDNGVEETSVVYTLTSFEDTIHYIPQIPVVVDGKTYKGKNLALKVVDVPVDTTMQEMVAPPFDVEDPPYDMEEWVPVIYLALALLLVVLLTIFLAVRLKRNKPVKINFSFKRKLLPHEQAMRDIERLKDSNLSHSEDQKEFYTQLTDILREYIAARFGFNAREMVSSEILENLEKEERKQMIDELRELFQTADLVKFAKSYAMQNENDSHLAHVLQFVETTKPEPEQNKQQKKKAEPKLSPEQLQKLRWRRVYQSAITLLSIVAVALFGVIVWFVWQLI